MGDRHRVEPTSPARLAVLVDGWLELPVLAAAGPRTDLIIERLIFDNNAFNLGPIVTGQLDIQVWRGAGAGSLGLALPCDFHPIAAVTVHQGQACIQHCHITAPYEKSVPETRHQQERNETRRRTRRVLDLETVPADPPPLPPGYVPPSASLNPDATIARTTQRSIKRVSIAGKPYDVHVCPHSEAVPVENLLGDVVAWLCPDCDTQLNPGWENA